MNTIEEVKELGLPNGSYIVVGGGCLAVHGLRETRDLDIVVSRALFDTLQKQGWPLDPVYEGKWNRQRLKRGRVEIYPDMLLEETNTFIDVGELIRRAEIIEGIPFLSLQELRIFKADARREKDLQDLVLIDNFLKAQT